MSAKPETKEFSTAAVLSAISGRLLCPIDDVLTKVESPQGTVAPPRPIMIPASGLADVTGE